MMELIVVGWYSVDLHGFTHKCVIRGEFGGLPYDEQYRRLQKGKRFLDSIFDLSVKTFIPPFNAYDENTLMALNELDFSIISGDMYGIFSDDIPMIYYPETLGKQFTTVADLKPLLDRNKNRDCIMVVMMHPDDIKESFTIKQLRDALSEIKALSYVNCCTFEQMSTIDVVSAHRVVVNHESNMLYKRLGMNGFLRKTSFSVFVRWVNAILYSVLSCVFFLLSSVMLKGKRNLLHKWLPCLFLFAIAFLGTWFHWLTPLKWLVACAAMSISLSLIINVVLKFAKP